MNEQIIRELYCEKGMSQVEIAAILNVTQKVIWGAMKRFGVPRRKAAKRDQQGEKNAYWGGKHGQVTYEAYHYRVIAKRGKPSACVDCGTVKKSLNYDWANITGNFADIYDYKRLCRSCHSKMDKKILNIKHMRTNSPLEASSVELADSTRG